MPRVMDKDKELADLQKSLDERGPSHNRQYVVKLPVLTAITFVKELMAEGVDSSNKLREIVEQHYEQKARGVSGGLPPFAAQVLDALCFQTGQGKEQVIAGLLETAGMARLERIANLKKRLEPESE